MKRAWLVLLLGSLSGCWVPVERGRQMEERIKRLEGQTETSIKQLDEQRAVMRDRLAEVQKKLAELNSTSHRTGADLAVNQDKLTDEVRRLHGMIEEQNHQIAQLKAENEARFAALKGVGALEEWEAKKKTSQLKVPGDKNELFAMAQEQEAKGERAVARELYQELVKRWPTTARAADAHFRIGEIHFSDKKYREAILAFGKVVQDFPKSDKAPDALFRTGESMAALDLREDAKKLFEEVRKRYPQSMAAKRAKARLTEQTKGKKRTPKPAAAPAPAQ